MDQPDRPHQAANSPPSSPPPPEAPHVARSPGASADDADERRSPFTPRELIRQLYLIGAAVVVLLSLAIWLMMSIA